MNSTPSKGKTEYVQMSFGDILGNALKYWTGGFRYYFPLYLVVQLVAIAMAYGIVLASAYDPWIVVLSSIFVPALGLGSTLSLVFALLPIDPATVAFIGFFVAVIVANMILQLLVTGTVIGHGADTHAGGKPSLGASFKVARMRVLSLLGATMLATVLTLSLVLAPIGVLALLMLGVIFTLFWNPFAAFAIGIASLIGVILSFVLLFYVIVRLSVFAPAIILDGASATTGMRQSWKLVHGHFWRVFGITFIIGLLIAIIGSLPASFTMLSMFVPMPAYTAVILTIVYAVVNACTMPLSPLAQTMLYEDLSARYYGA